MELVYPVLVIAAALAAIVYIVLPLVSGTNTWISAFPRYVEIPASSLDALSEPARAFFRRSFEGLEGLGFVRIACGRQIRQVDTVSIYAVVFRKDPERDWAVLTYVVVDAAASKQEMFGLDISTYYSDETVVATSNSAGLPLWAPSPRRAQALLPKIDEAARLYAVHRERLRRHPASAAVADLADSRALTWIAEGIQRDLREQEAEGWFYLDPGTLRYYPTTKGAYLMTWRQLWPITTFRRLRRDLAASRLNRSVPT